jgi:ribosomal protein S18 acetylase RimI-like enzyme
MSTLTAGKINTATDAEKNGVIAALAAAFADDPAVRWMYPDNAQFRREFPGFAEAFGGRAFAAGTAHVSDGFAGAALWLPPGTAPDEDALMGHIERTATSVDQNVLFAVFEAMGGYHPEGPHWYLPLIGVVPVAQGRGIGSALLGHALAAADRDRLPAYLESSNARNIPLYQRHGFALLGTIRHGDCPPIFPMLREPR